MIHVYKNIYTSGVCGLYRIDVSYSIVCFRLTADALRLVSYMKNPIYIIEHDHQIRESLSWMMKQSNILIVCQYGITDCCIPLVFYLKTIKCIDIDTVLHNAGLFITAEDREIFKI